MITETRDLNSDDENGEDLHLQKKWRSGEERIDQNVSKILRGKERQRNRRRH